MPDQRVLKFRAWDKQKKQWASVNLQDWDSWMGPSMNQITAPNESAPRTFALESCDRYIWVQFTGLHDCHGTEIYEGDCLGGIFAMLVIGWCPKQGGFELFTPHDECMACAGDAHWHEVVEDKTREILGNVYEHPHLLHGTTDA